MARPSRLKPKLNKPPEQRCHSSFIQRNSYIFNTCLNKKKHHRSIHNIRLQMIIDNQVFEQYLYSRGKYSCCVGLHRPTWIGSQPRASDPSPPAVSIESGRCGCRLSGRNYRLNAGRMAHTVLPPSCPPPPPPPPLIPLGKYYKA